MNLFQQLFHQPKSVRLRGWVFQVHLWIGVSIGIYAGVIGLSGSALVFKDEFQAAAVEKALPPIAAGEMVSPDDAAAAVLNDVPGGRLATLYFPNERTGSYVGLVAVAGERRRVVVDPRTGESVAIAESTPAMWRWLTQLHFNLLAGRMGRIINGVGGLLMSLLCVSGVVIWWQGRAQWSRGLTIDWRARWKKVNWDLHSAAGFWCVAFLFLLSITGAYFSWPQVYRDLVSAAFPLTTSQAPREVPPGERLASLSEIASAARSAAPGRHLSHMIFGERPEQPVRVILSGGPARGHQSFDRDTVYVDPFRVQVMQASLASGRTFGDKIVTAIVSIHFGNFAGNWSKALWLVLGLAPVALFVTGYVMWWNRVVARSWASWKTQREGRSPHETGPREADVRTSAAVRSDSSSA